MRIAIVGTRGIPNRYGGFEQCAQEIAPRFVAAGHDVTVFSPASHDYREPTYRGVKIDRIAWDEARLGPLGLFTYEYLALRGVERLRADVALVLGHTPSGLFLKGARRRPYAVVMNVDGVERWRAKFGWAKRQLLIAGERGAVRRSDVLIADNPGIATYLRNEFGVASTCIEYGATIPATIADPAAGDPAPGTYDLAIARLEPENNVAMIADGVLASPGDRPLHIVGGLTTPYARVLAARYAGRERIVLRGAIFDADRLNSLRRHANLYFHGHSVGGTNPALLEAMAAGARIAAHDNMFNRAVLGNNAGYFADAAAVTRLAAGIDPPGPPEATAANAARISGYYTWDRIAGLYLAAATEALAVHAAARVAD